MDSPYMWWPSNLVQVSLFRYLNLTILSGLVIFGVFIFFGYVNEKD